MLVIEEESGYAREPPLRRIARRHSGTERGPRLYAPTTPMSRARSQLSAISPWELDGGSASGTRLCGCPETEKRSRGSRRCPHNVDAASVTAEP